MEIRKGHRSVHKKMRSEDSPLLEINSFNGWNYLAGRSEIADGRGWIFIGGGDITNKIVFRTPELKKKHLLVKDIDGCPTTVIKMHIRNLKALQKARCVTAFYGLMSQWLAEVDIKNFFYDLWIKRHNYDAIKAQRGDEFRKRHGMKPQGGKYIHTSRWG